MKFSVFVAVLCLLAAVVDVDCAPCFTELGLQKVSQYFNETLEGNDVRPCIYITPVNSTEIEDESGQQIVVLKLRPCHEVEGNSSEVKGRQIFFDFGLHFYDYYEYHEYEQFGWLRATAWEEPFRSQGLIEDCNSTERMGFVIRSDGENSTESELSARFDDYDYDSSEERDWDRSIPRFNSTPDQPVEPTSTLNHRSDASTERMVLFRSGENTTEFSWSARFDYIDSEEEEESTLSPRNDSTQFETSNSTFHPRADAVTQDRLEGTTPTSEPMDDSSVSGRSHVSTFAPEDDSATQIPSLRYRYPITLPADNDDTTPIFRRYKRSMDLATSTPTFEIVTSEAELTTAVEDQPQTNRTSFNSLAAFFRSFFIPPVTQSD